MAQSLKTPHFGHNLWPHCPRATPLSFCHWKPIPIIPEIPRWRGFPLMAGASPPAASETSFLLSQHSFPNLQRRPANLPFPEKRDNSSRNSPRRAQPERATHFHSATDSHNSRNSRRVRAIASRHGARAPRVLGVPSSLFTYAEPDSYNSRNRRGWELVAMAASRQSASTLRKVRHFPPKNPCKSVS
jgi:hypothetical protein